MAVAVADADSKNPAKNVHADSEIMLIISSLRDRAGSAISQTHRANEFACKKMKVLKQSPSRNSIYLLKALGCDLRVNPKPLVAILAAQLR